MKYELQIFPDRPTLPVPKIGDKFIVSKIIENVLDVHYGRCIVVELEPEEKESVRLDDLIRRLQERNAELDKEVRS